MNGQDPQPPPRITPPEPVQNRDSLAEGVIDRTVPPPPPKHHNKLGMAGLLNQFKHVYDMLNPGDSFVINYAKHEIPKNYATTAGHTLTKRYKGLRKFTSRIDKSDPSYVRIWRTE